MPFKSQAQRRLFYAMQEKGMISKETLDRWEKETPPGRLPDKAGDQPTKASGRSGRKKRRKH